MDSYAVRRRRDPAYREWQREYHRAWKLKTRYGITLEDYDRMLGAQEGKCAICRAAEPGGTGDNFHVDHCHATGRVRGLLCATCNLALGQLEDHLDAALSYMGGGDVSQN